MIPPKVLIVEDDSSTRLLLQAVVERNHLLPVSASDGRIARTLLATDVFDAILLDLRLPEVSGEELLLDLDGDQRRRVLVVTAAPPAEWRTRFDDQVWGVIQKPFDVYELEALLMACLSDPQ